MQGLDILLLDRLLRHQRDMQLARGRADRFGIVAVVLLPTHERLDVLRADDLHLMSERFELALPVEGAGARFDSNGATADLCQNVAQLIAHHASLQHYSSLPVYAV